MWGGGGLEVGEGVEGHLPVQLHSLHGLVLVQKHGSILEEQALHLWYAVLLRQGNSLIPLAERHTALHSALHLPTLHHPTQGQPCHAAECAASDQRGTCHKALIVSEHICLCFLGLQKGRECQEVP